MPGTAATIRGAGSGAIKEKALTLALATALRDSLLEQGGVRIALTRGDDRYLLLEERSGIARSTIHARWPTRDQLMAEALRAHNSTFQIEPRDDWRDHLHHIAVAFRDFSARPDEIAINTLTTRLGGDFLAEETHRQWQSISGGMAEPLRKAQQSGEIRADIDPIIVISTLFTSIAGHIVIAKDVPSDDHLRQLVSLLISGCQAPALST